MSGPSLDDIEALSLLRSKPAFLEDLMLDDAIARATHLICSLANDRLSDTMSAAEKSQKKQLIDMLFDWVKDARISRSLRRTGKPNSG